MKNHYINCLRGVAIFLMLWGHCVQVCIPAGVDFFGNPVFRFIYSFHMPLFMLISGYLFRLSFERRTWEELLSRRCGSLLKTLLIWNILIYFLSDGLFAALRGDVWALLDGRFLSALSGLWFLWSTLACSLAVGFTFKKATRPWARAMLAVVGGVFVLLLPNGVYNLFMYPYFLIGFLFSALRERLPKGVLRLRYLALPIFPVLLFFFEKRHYIYTSWMFGSEYTPLQYLEIDLFRFLIGLAGSVFACVLVEWLCHLAVRVKAVRFLGNKLAYLGEKSLQFYVLSTLFLSTYLLKLYPSLAALMPTVDAFFATHTGLFSFGVMLPLAVLVSLGLGVLIRLLERIGLSRGLFGR